MSGRRIIYLRDGRITDETRMERAHDPRAVLSRLLRMEGG